MSRVGWLASALSLVLLCGSWTHLELGAGNYGTDGHTQASQSMTVLQKLQVVTDKENYIDGLDKTGRGNYCPEEQFGVLFWTLDQLVARYGHTGIFFVNDLYDEYAEVAADRLRVYAESRGYLSVAIKTLSGDYEKLDFKDVLSPIGIDRFTTIHLKNPEISLFHDAMDGDALSSTHETRAKSRALLAHLAAWSESGLYLFILDHDDFLPEAEREEFIHHGIFYHPTTDWEAVPYIYPEGKLFSSPGAVFHIKDPDCHLRFTASCH